jgi:site-specific recombinase XerD
MNPGFRGGLAAGIASAPAKFDHSLTARFCDRSKSEATRKTYRQAIDGFFRFMGNTHPAVIDQNDIILWRDHLQNQKEKSTTVALKVSVLRSFFEYLYGNGIVLTNPAAGPSVRVLLVRSKPQSRALSEKEIGHLLAGPNTRTADGARDYTILLMLMESGLNVGDLCSLRVSSVRTVSANSVLVSRGRGGVDRIAPLSGEVHYAIDNYLQLDAERRRRMRSNGAEAFLFQPHSNYRTLEFNRSLTDRWVEMLVGKWASYAGLGRVTPRDLRRTGESSQL